MDEPADSSGAGPSSRSLPMALLAALGVLALTDLGLDLRESPSRLHVLVEACAGITGLGGGAWLWIQARRAREAARRLALDLATSRAEAERWRAESREVVRGLREALDRQFERWSLSPAEREVALFLINGMSHAAIAQARNASERTVRDQARAVYRKSGLSGRAELAAFFLEDLLEP